MGLGFTDPLGTTGGGRYEPGDDYYIGGRWRKKPNSGLLEIEVWDVRNQRMLWVDAIWDAANDEVIPLDSKYRNTSKRYQIANMFTRNFADASGSDAAGEAQNFAVTPVGSGSSGVVVGVVALLALYLATR